MSHVHKMRLIILAVALVLSVSANDLLAQDWKKQITEASKKSVEVANAAQRMHTVVMTTAPEVARDGYRRPTTNRYQRHERTVYLELGMDRTPYTCTVIGGDLTRVDVEHIVALAEAHDSGLPASLMLEFSGDPANLTVAMPRENRTVKSDKDAADYIPPRNRCWFAGRVLDVKLRWGLTVDAAESVVLIGAMEGCSTRAVARPSC